MKAIITDKKFVVVGLGQTGLSCVRYLRGLGKSLLVMDTRDNPPGLSLLKQEYPEITVVLGGLDPAQLLAADEIILSPGIALSTPEIQRAREHGVRIRGDIDLFSDQAEAPVVAITGSNGKSTVTSLVGEMARSAGLNVAVGGNIGVPALDILADDRDIYVLELSSFQLETTQALNATSVVLLNLSEDHMDRYDSKMAYLQAKQRIFFGAQNVIVNDDEPLSAPLVNNKMRISHFGLHAQDINKFSVLESEGERYLCKGFQPLLKISEIKIHGEHNISNCLAALALGDSIGLPMQAMLDAIRNFTGLAHRCQWVRCLDNVNYVNDSKGTNPGAVVTALQGLGKHIQGRIVLIAGGESKGADLSSLVEPVKRFVKALVLIGRDAGKFESLLNTCVPVTHASTMAEAVRSCRTLAEGGDLVLLSPACASFDMFRNYEHRGDVFTEEVMKL
jgi:UDP-N-acetylmuramoylalanine--D-glutamate ligase